MKKKHFLMAIGCMVAIGLLVVCSANAETIAESGFNGDGSGIQDPVDFTLGDLNGQGGTGSGWTIPWTKYKSTVFGGSSTVQNTVIKEGDQAALAAGGGTSSNAQATAYGRTFTPQSDDLVLIEFTLQIGAEPQPFNIYLCDFIDFSAGTNNSIPAMIRIHGVPTTAIQQDTSEGSVDTKFPRSAMVVDTWYTVGMLLDMDAQTYQVGLDGDYDVARSFLQPSTAVDGGFWLVYKSAVYFDEVRVTCIPEPSTLVLLCLAVVGVMVGRCRRR